MGMGLDITVGLHGRPTVLHLAQQTNTKCTVGQTNNTPRVHYPCSVLINNSDLILLQGQLLPNAFVGTKWK